MADIELTQKALDALVIMNAVVKNMRLYPPTSARIVNAVERLYRDFLDMLEMEGSIIFAQSEKSILIGGGPLSQQDQEKWQVSAFLKILLEFDIQSITFDKGLKKDELSSFLEILSKKAEVVKSEGGLPLIVKEKNLAHIWLDKGINVAAEKNQQIISGDKPVKALVSYYEDASVKVDMSNEEISVKTQIPESGAALEKTDDQNQILNLKEALRSFPEDDQKAFLDAPLMSALPKLFEQLDAQKEHETMAIIISRLVGNLFSKNADVRSQASTALADIFAGLSHARQNKLITRLSTHLIDWIKIEPLATLAYKRICNNLKDLVHDFIRQGRFAEAIPILDVFSNISAGILEKNDKAQEISSDIIRSLASEEHLSILFTAFNTNNPDTQVGSGGVLVRLGDAAMNRLLDILRDKVDSDDRVRIMNIFIGIGTRAVPVIRDRISKTAPWYYSRNLAYILGHIGNESSASALQPLLLHGNKRLRMEALKSIYRTGGKERGAILLSVLPLVDDQFKLNIIETLGNAKCVDAVPELLLYMLKKQRLVAPSLRADREEKICAALGSIGSPEALPALSKIAKSMSLFRIRPYAAKVKIAAGLAVVSIKKKQEEAAQATKATEAAQEAKAAEVLDAVEVSS